MMRLPPSTAPSGRAAPGGGGGGGSGRAAPRSSRAEQGGGGSPPAGIVLQSEGVIYDSADITSGPWPRMFVVAACRITSGDCYFSSDETTYL